MKRRERRLLRFARVVEGAVMLYLLFAVVWTLCYAVGDIFRAMGVG